MKTPYSQHDYKFGQTILTLRTAIGLTQAGLAAHLGVSRRTVGAWEAGSSYPSAEHLKELIALAVKSRAFPAGSAAQKIRVLWKEAHQKVLLDEAWLSALLNKPSSPSSGAKPSPTEGAKISALAMSDSVMQPGLNGECSEERSVSPESPISSQHPRSQLPFGKFSSWIYITLASTIMVLLVLGSAFVFPFILRKSSSDLFPVLCSGRFQSQNSGLVALPAASTLPDGESIGLSEGAVIFDLQRRNSQEVQAKVQAANATAKNPQLVIPGLKRAISNDQTDAEAQIYLENWAVLGSNHPHITIVVGVSFADTTIAGSRGALQGAFAAQKECNDQNRSDISKALIVLMIANIGGNTLDDRADSATFVANQIVDQASKDPTIVAIMGWLSSTDSINVNHRLKIRGSDLPMVSPSSASDELGERFNFFRICPPNSKQVQMAENFILKKMKKKRIAIIYDSTISFGLNMQAGFSKDVPNNLVGSESYIGADAKTLQDALTKVLIQHPDSIFFAGYVGDLDKLLSNISSTPYADLLIVGGDTLANTSAYPNPLPDLHNVYFTAFASPNAWDNIDLKPPFFQNYKSDFGMVMGANGLLSIDNNVMLGYDALLTLLHGSQQVLSTHNTLTPSELTRALRQIKGRDAIQGVTGRIAFEENGDQNNKRILLEHIQGTSLKVDDSQGCFLLTDACGKN